MPLTTGIRSWNLAPSGIIEQVLVPQTEFAARTEDEVAADMEARYWAPLDGERAAIALSVNGLTVDGLTDRDLAAGERGSALLAKVIAEISAAFEDAGVRPDIALVQAQDIAGFLACSTFLSAYELLVTPDATQVKHQQAIDVRTDGNTVCFHMTTTYTDIDNEGQNPPPLTQVVDLAVKLTSTRRSSSARQLEAEVCTATVQVAQPSQRQVLVEQTKRRLDVPAASLSRWERVKHALAPLFGARGIRFVVGCVDELTDPRELARPPGIALHLDGIEDPSAWLVRAEQAYGKRRHIVARYRSDNVAYLVLRNGIAVDAGTQRKVTDRCARTLAANRANDLRQDRNLNIGNPSLTCCVPPLARRTSPRVTPLPPPTYGGGSAHVRELARLAAQNNERLNDEVCAMLDRALFPAPGTPQIVFQVDGDDIINAGLERLRSACINLSNVAQQPLPKREDQDRNFIDWARYQNVMHFPLDAQDFFLAGKTAMFARAIEFIERSLPDDHDLRRQVLATLARGEAAMHRVSQNNGLPVFENPRNERRKITLTRQTIGHRLANRVDITFHSWQHTLDHDARVRFGTEAHDVFPARLLRTAILLRKASYRVTNENTELTSLQYEARLALHAEARDAAHPHQPHGEEDV